MPSPHRNTNVSASEPASDAPDAETPPVPLAELVKARTPVPEIGGRRDGPDPTRYGDWEKNGRCIDF
jgi:hypothetical protein